MALFVVLKPSLRRRGSNPPTGAGLRGAAGGCGLDLGEANLETAAAHRATASSTVWLRVELTGSLLCNCKMAGSPFLLFGDFPEPTSGFLLSHISFLMSSLPTLTPSHPFSSVQYFYLCRAPYSWHSPPWHHQLRHFSYIHNHSSSL